MTQWIHQSIAQALFLEKSDGHALPQGQLPQLALAWEPTDIDLIQLPEKNLLVYFWEPGVAFRLALAEANLSGLPELRKNFKQERNGWRMAMSIARRWDEAITRGSCGMMLSFSSSRRFRSRS